MISETTFVLVITTFFLIVVAFLGQWLDTAARIRERMELESEFLSDED